MPDRKGKVSCATGWSVDISFRNSRGIGLETSILFASEGANVLLVDINVGNAEKAVSLISDRYPNVKVKATKADVGKEVDVKNAVDLAVKEFGRLDVVVRLTFSFLDCNLTRVDVM